MLTRAGLSRWPFFRDVLRCESHRRAEVSLRAACGSRSEPRPLEPLAAPGGSPRLQSGEQGFQALRQKSDAAHPLRFSAGRTRERALQACV